MPENVLDRVDAAIDRATALDRYLRRVHTDDHTEPHSDRQSTGQLKHLDLGRTCKIVYGKVVDAVAYCHWYKVQPEGAKTTIPCCMLSGTALTPFGVREHNQLHPNAGVYLLLHPTSPYGVIIGVEPKHGFDGTKALSDYVSLCSAHSIQTEQVHSFPFTLPKNGTVVDWSGGRPADGTCAGEWGMFAESGVALFIDSAMAFLRADENTGVWAFYRDQMLRLAGHNLQIRAAGWEVEALDDQGEFTHAEGFTPYPWEQLGGFERGTTLHKEKSVQAQQVDEPHYSKYEPLHDDQQPFHRTRHYRGYAGQGGKRQVIAPPVGATGVNRYSDRARYLGLFEETVAQTGQWTVRTAKGIRLVKRLLVPAAKLVKRPEDSEGDDEENYKAASAQGAGPDHKVGDVATSGPDPHMNRLLGVMDGQTYAVNWEGVVGFHYHKKDYYLPEESELKGDVGASNIAKIPFGDLSGRTFMDPRPPARLKIDHRYQSVEYYPSISYVELADDGSVEMGDGYGSVIRLGGGNGYIAPAGDLVLQPGRNLVVMAGRDVSVRANKHLELATTEKDVRIHSGRNMEVSAEDGVLIESKSEEVGWSGWRDTVGDDVTQHGIHLKAAKSAVCSWSDLLYLRTGIGSPGIGLYIDAGKGEGSIGVNCNVTETWARAAVAHYLGGGPSVASAYLWAPGSAIIGGTVCQDGSFVSTGTVLSDGWLLSASGHVGTAQADAYDNKVPALKDQGLAQAQSSVEECRQSHDTARNNAGTQYGNVWDNALYVEGFCGDDQTIAEILFSFRTTPQYRAADYRLYEARWQQLARIWGTGTGFWTERPVPKSGQDTYPFPGKTKLADDPALYQQDLELFDLAEGVAKPRTDAGYEAPRYGTPAPVTINGNYRVID